MKRKNEIKLRLYDDEFNKLNLEVEKSGLSREAYLRSLIKHETSKRKTNRRLFGSHSIS